MRGSRKTDSKLDVSEDDKDSKSEDREGYIWVVMANESPQRAFVNSEKANDYMKYNQEQEEKRNKPWIFWRSYLLKLEK
jgi:hypothetical protein